MKMMLSLLDGPAWGHLVEALLHTLWIGALAALALFALLRRVPAGRADLRYGAAVLALLAAFGGGLLAFAILEYSPELAQVSAHAFASNAPADSLSPVVPQSAIRNPHFSKPHAASAPPVTAWLACAWLAGAALMLARTLRRIAFAGRIRAACLPVEDPAILGILDELRATLNLARRVLVLAGDSKAFPCVVGALWPAVLLPASLLSGVPRDHLRAILAHELAHIRRHDYLVNLIQMLIESLLFFNPFVWWLSRQVRLEREACCDALAARATGESLSYARALVDFAQTVSTDFPALTKLDIGHLTLDVPAFAGSRPPSTLMDRVRRLAQPGHRPVLRLPWSSAMAYLVVSALALACLKKASDGAVALAVKMLSPQERVEKIAEIQKTHGIPRYDASTEEKTSVTVSGKLVPVDGGALPSRSIPIVIHSSRTNMGTNAKPDGSFKTQISGNNIRISGKVPGFAPFHAGPFDVPPSGKIENIRIELRRGIMAEVKVVDPQGRPVPDVELSGYFNTPGSMHMSTWYGATALRTDAQGVAVVDDASTYSAHLTGKAPGFETTEWKEVGMKRGAPTLLTIRPALPTEVTLVDSQNGRPVAGAEFRLVATLSSKGSSFIGSEDDPPLVVSDASGRVRLTTLNRDFDHAILIDAKGYRRKIVKSLRAGQTLKVEMLPPLIVRGRVLGAQYLEKYSKKKAVNYSQAFEAKNNSSYQFATREAPVKITGDEGTFEISNIWEGKLDISIGEYGRTVKERHLEVSDPVTEVVLDLRPPGQIPAGDTITSETREVMVRIDVPGGSPPPSGTIQASYFKPDETLYLKGHDVKVTSSLVRFRIPVPNQLSLSAKQLPGYWVPDMWGIKVEKAPNPLELNLEATPAGAIFGRVFEANGKPASGIMVSVIQIQTAPGQENSSLNIEGKNSSSPDDMISKFVLAPLPLGGTYAALVSRGACYVVSEPINITAINPIDEIALTLPEGVNVTGCVLDESGKPIEGINVSLGILVHNFGSGASGVAVGPDGAFAFDHVNPDFSGLYRIHASGPGYQPAKVNFKPNGRPVEVRMKRGSIVTGRVLDAETGKPLPEAEVYALEQNGDWSFSDADEKTDAQGRFKLSQLADGREYKINCRSGQVVGGEVIARAGSGQGVELRVKLSEYEKKRRAGLAN